jgi:acetylornithine/N-succinyldiaminopimelate aminotransferase
MTGIPILFVGGEGVYIIDEQGDRYLDLLERHRRECAGLRPSGDCECHCGTEPKLIHTSNLYYHEGQAELALRLTERTGMDRAFFATPARKRGRAR